MAKRSTAVFCAVLFLVVLVISAIWVDWRPESSTPAGIPAELHTKVVDGFVGNKSYSDVESTNLGVGATLRPTIRRSTAPPSLAPSVVNPTQASTSSPTSIRSQGLEMIETGPPSVHPIETQATAPPSYTSNAPTRGPETTSQSVLDDFSICRLSKVELPGISVDWEIKYHCEGSEYETYAQDLIQQTVDIIAASDHPSNLTWGRRSQALPPYSRTLIVGNSQTRQLAQVLVCQQVQKSPIAIYTRLDTYTIVVEFENNATLTLVSNTYSVFSLDWQSLLEKQVNASLASFDHIIIGPREKCTTGDQQSFFSKRMQEMTKNMNDVDCLQHDPPTVFDWYTALKQNPKQQSLVWVGSFSQTRSQTLREEYYQIQQAMLEHERERNDPSGTNGGRNTVNLSFIYPRLYLASSSTIASILTTSPSNRFSIDDLHTEQKADCMSVSTDDLPGVCDNRTRGNPCTGPMGGLTDLVVFDVVEFLWTRSTARPWFIFKPFLMQLTQAQASWQKQPPMLAEPTYCRSPTVMGLDIFSETQPVFYQCDGPLYHDYTASLYPFVQNRYDALSEHDDLSSSKTTRPTWGHRNFGLPPNSRILFYGNSHTRQVAKSLACQQMELGHLKAVVNRDHGGKVQEYDTVNNSTVVVLANGYAPYSWHWVNLTEEELGEPLDSFDAVVMGAFNKCDGINNFSNEMQAISERMEEVDCLHIPPPTLTEMSRYFKGPIIYVTMFVPSANEQNPDVTRAELFKITAATGRTNLHLVNSHQHTHEMNEKECRGELRLETTDCTTGSFTTHVCTGAQGGYADLIAWDVIELLHQELGDDR